MIFYNISVNNSINHHLSNVRVAVFVAFLVFLASFSSKILLISSLTTALQLPPFLLFLTSWILRVPWYIFSIPRQHAGHTRVAGVY